MNDKQNNIMIYEDKDGVTKVSVKFIDEDIWLTKYQIADINKTTRQNIEQHINNIYHDNIYYLKGLLSTFVYRQKNAII